MKLGQRAGQRGADLQRGQHAETLLQPDQRQPLDGVQDERQAARAVLLQRVGNRDSRDPQLAQYTVFVPEPYEGARIGIIRARYLDGGWSVVSLPEATVESRLTALKECVRYSVPISCAHCPVARK